MTTAAWLAALVGGLGTFLERWSFLAVADRTAGLPGPVREALRMIPAAAMAALVAPAVLRGSAGEGGLLDLWDARLPAAVLGMLAMWRWRNVLAAITVGMAVLLGLEAIT